MKILRRLRLGEHLMPRIRASDPDQKVVFGRYVADNIALAFASVLTTDEHVDELLGATRIEVEESRRAH